MAVVHGALWRRILWLADWRRGGAALGICLRQLLAKAWALLWPADLRPPMAPSWARLRILFLKPAFAILWPAGWRHRAMTIGLGLLVVLPAAYSILWTVAADMLEARFREAVAANANEHLVISHGKLHHFGYPGAVRLEVSDPSYAYTWIRSDGSIATLTWSDTRMEVSTSPFRPSVLRFDWPKKAVIETTAPDGAALPPVSLRAETARVDVMLSEGRALPIMAELTYVSALKGTEGTEAELLERFDFTGDYGNGAEEPSANWRFEATGLRGVDLETGKLQTRDASDQRGIDRLTGVIKVFGPLPEPNSDASMRAWRDAKGRVELRDGHFETPKLKAAFAGSFALDDELRPVSRVDTTIHGLGSAVKRDELGPIGEQDNVESLLVVVLGLLSGQDDPNGPVELHFETRNGRAYVGSALGSIRIGKVGPIDFEAANGPLVPFSFRFKD